MTENNMAKIARLVAFPGSPDDMMDTIAALRARVAKLEAQNKALHARLEELDNEVRGLRAWHEETTDAETDAEKGEKP